VLDLVEPVIGPDIALWSSHFLSKDPFTGKPTPWHEDSAYWQGRLSAYDRIVTVWLALTRSDCENGCVRVIPGTHNAGFSEYEATGRERFFATQIKGEVDESSAIDFELGPGECSLHDGRIIHGARANTSPHRRTGYTMRYFSAAIRVIPEANPGHRIWLARGRDLAGNAYEAS
jgi:ectoine hydroxylase-related dioxygenase (phytanoyl-CoA dioxygenase family)